MPKYHVRTQSGEVYDITADSIEQNEDTPQIVKFLKGKKTIAVENNAATVRPA